MDGSAAVIGEMMLPILEPPRPGRVAPGTRPRPRLPAHELPARRRRGPRPRPRLHARRRTSPLRRRPRTGARVDAAWRDLMRFEIDRCRALYRSADRGIAMLPPSSAPLHPRRPRPVLAGSSIASRPPTTTSSPRGPACRRGARSRRSRRRRRWHDEHGVGGAVGRRLGVRAAAPLPSRPAARTALRVDRTRCRSSCPPATKRRRCPCCSTRSGGSTRRRTRCSWSTTARPTAPRRSPSSTEPRWSRRRRWRPAGSASPPPATSARWSRPGATCSFLDADTALAPDGALPGSLRPHPDGLLSVQPHHDTVHAYEQLSAFPNIVSMMGGGAFAPWSSRPPAGRLRAVPAHLAQPTTRAAGGHAAGARLGRRGHRSRSAVRVASGFRSAAPAAATPCASGCTRVGWASWSRDGPRTSGAAPPARRAYLRSSRRGGWPRAQRSQPVRS